MLSLSAELPAGSGGILTWEVLPLEVLPCLVTASGDCIRSIVGLRIFPVFLDAAVETGGGSLSLPDWEMPLLGVIETGGGPPPFFLFRSRRVISAGLATARHIHRLHKHSPTVAYLMHRLATAMAREPGFRLTCRVRGLAVLRPGTCRPRFRARALL